MKAARWLAPERLELADEPEPVLGAADILIEVAACGICGSDLESWRHGSNVTAGQVMGHEFGGRVLVAGPQSTIPTGTLVAVRPLLACRECPQCRRRQPQLCERSLLRGLGYGLPGGFAERVRVPGARVGQNVFPLPPGLDPAHSALVEPLAVARRAVKQAAVEPGDVVVVFGLGQIGLGAVALARLAGASHVVGVDPSPLRRAAAGRLGASTLVDPIEEKPDAAVRRVTGSGAYGLGAAADAAIECSGVPSSFAAAIKSLRPGGRLSLVAHSREPFQFKSGRVVEKEIRVQGSFAYDDEMREIADLIAIGLIDLAPFVSHIFPLENIDEAFRQQADASSSLKVLVQP